MRISSMPSSLGDHRWLLNVADIKARMQDQCAGVSERRGNTVVSHVRLHTSLAQEAEAGSPIHKVTSPPIAGNDSRRSDYGSSTCVVFRLVEGVESV